MATLTGQTAELPGIKESELARLGPCRVCGKPLLEGDITFYMIMIARAGFCRDAIKRRVGLQMVLGGAGALAAAMGPDEDLAKVIDGPQEMAVHERCAHIGHLLELFREAGS